MRKFLIFLSLLFFVRLIPLQPMNLGSYLGGFGKNCTTSSEESVKRLGLSNFLSQTARRQALNRNIEINILDLPVEIMDRILDNVFMLPLNSTSNIKLFYDNVLFCTEVCTSFYDIFKSEIFIVNQALKYNISPIIIAIIIKSEEVIKKLLNKENVDLKQEFLFWAIFTKSSKEIVQLLLDKGLDVNGRCWQNYTPLFYAILCKSSKNIVQLLLNYGADINATCFNMSPLNIAVGRSSREIIELLEKRGAVIYA